jgi:spore coat polysaccharide biosynthesis predicted glycosyltransferase SpsG
MKKNVAILVCDNGLGHTRRAALIAKELFNRSYKVYLYCNITLVKKIIEILAIDLSCISLVNFTPNVFSQINLSDRMKIKKIQIPNINLQSYDLVISDNLLEVLELRPDTIISGSFFWHKSFRDISSEYFAYSENLLQKYKPKIISSSLFAHPYLECYENFYKIGLFSCANFLDKNFQKKKHTYDDNQVTFNILISIGMGTNSTFDIKFISDLIKFKEKFMPNLKVYIEPKLWNKSMPSWIVKATYDLKMFQSIDMAIIRASVGTLSEVLGFSTSIFIISMLDDSLEIVFNAKKLENLGFAVCVKSVAEALDIYSLRRAKFENNSLHEHTRAEINFDGAENFVDLILNIK